MCSKEKKSRYRKINKSLKTFNTILSDSDQGFFTSCSDLNCDIELKYYNEMNVLRTRIGRIHQYLCFLQRPDHQGKFTGTITETHYHLFLTYSYRRRERAVTLLPLRSTLIWGLIVVLFLPPANEVEGR